MPYRFKSRRSLGAEVRRLADHQLTLAIQELRAVGDARADNVVHTARRHVKKVRALTRLVEPALGDRFRRIDRHLKMASALLAPIADGRAIIGTLTRVQAKYGLADTECSIDSIREHLLERAARIDRQAQLDRVLPRVARLLRTEQTRLAGCTLNARGFHAVGPGLEKTMRRARRAMAEAVVYPTAENHEVWRRRVKDLWLQMRLMRKRCRNQLLRDQHRLEALDGCLGEHHDVILLEHVLRTESRLPRRQAAECLRALHHHRGYLRHRALVLGRRIFREKPRHFVRRVQREWVPGVRRARSSHHRVRRAA